MLLGTTEHGTHHAWLHAERQFLRTSRSHEPLPPAPASWSRTRSVTGWTKAPGSPGNAEWGQRVTAARRLPIVIVLPTVTRALVVSFRFPVPVVSVSV
jgi:hypothetical protein